MINTHCTVVVPGWPQKEIGYGTLVRAYDAKFQLTLTNNAQMSLLRLNARLCLESYIGQEKAQLFQWADVQAIEKITPQDAIPLEFTLRPLFPGLVSIALYLTDSANNAVMAKRDADSDYQKAPVRWWFHVVDDISLETLRALKQLTKAIRHKAKANE